MHKPSVFPDSSVIIAALLSSRGGSAFLLTQLNDKAQFQINEFVFAEVRGILETKFGAQPELSGHLFLLLGVAGVVTLPNPSKRDLRSAAKHISKNDAPILAAALEHSDYLVTLDKEFFKQTIVDIAHNQELSIKTPGDLIALLR